MTAARPPILIFAISSTNRGGTRVAYVIAAYNDMAKFHDVQGNDILLIGLDESIIPGSASRHPTIESLEWTVAGTRRMPHISSGARTVRLRPSTHPRLAPVPT